MHLDQYYLEPSLEHGGSQRGIDEPSRERSEGPPFALPEEGRSEAEADVARQWLAMELHDGLVQDATAALMELQSVLAESSLPEGRVRHRIDRAASHLRDAIDEARRLIAGVRPPALDELGLVRAVEQLASQSDEHVIEVVAEEIPDLAPALEAEAYRIVQEALHNLRRHSRSARGAVRLQCRDGQLCLEIRDWGVGFDPAAIAPGRFGLAGIQQRARRLRGRVSVESALGRGTCIRVELPLTPPQRFADIYS